MYGSSDGLRFDELRLLSGLYPIAIAEAQGFLYSGSCF